MENKYRTTRFVLVFKTNIKCKDDVRCLAPILDSSIGITKWSVDLSDVDNVLRIESEHSDCEKVITLVTNAGYICEELLD
jgi:hypothetical protein